MYLENLKFLYHRKICNFKCYLYLVFTSCNSLVVLHNSHGKEQKQNLVRKRFRRLVVCFVIVEPALGLAILQ